MQIFLKTIAALPLLLLGAACAGNSGTDKGTDGGTTLPAAEQFPLPQIAPEVTDPQQRASVAASRFWDGAVLAAEVDTVTPALEQAFANFAAIAQMAGDTDSVARGVSAILGKGGAELIMPLAERYLYDPNSPMRSEELFILFLQQAPGWARTEGLLEHALKNRRGTRAADFRFTDSRGRKGTLSGFVAERGETLVYFFDSECEVCKRLIPMAAEMAAGRPVLAVCPKANAARFGEAVSFFPQDWTVAEDDGAIDSEDLYVFPALPSVYLIAEDMTVIEKDAPIPSAE